MEDTTILLLYTVGLFFIYAVMCGFLSFIQETTKDISHLVYNLGGTSTNTVSAKVDDDEGDDEVDDEGDDEEYKKDTDTTDEEATDEEATDEEATDEEATDEGGNESDDEDACQRWQEGRECDWHTLVDQIYSKLAPKFEKLERNVSFLNR